MLTNDLLDQVRAPYGCVYKITNKINGKSYIGQTCKSGAVRFKEHLRAANRSNPKGMCAILPSAIRKYGKEAFSFEELAVAFDMLSLDLAEQELIRTYGTLVPAGYNVDLGGRHGQRRLGFLTRTKISTANSGRRHTNTPKCPYPSKRRRPPGGVPRPVVGVHMDTGERLYLPNMCADPRFDFRLIHKCCSGQRRTHRRYYWEYEARCLS